MGIWEKESFRKFEIILENVEAIQNNNSTKNEMANLKGNFASKYHSIYSQICIENKTDKNIWAQSACFKMGGKEVIKIIHNIICN